MKKISALLLCLCLMAGTLTACAVNGPDSPDTTAADGTTAAGGDDATTAASGDDSKTDALKAALKAEFLKAADEVTVSGDSVTLTRDGIFFGNNLLSELFKLG